jgi:hypothetical protein
MMTMRTSKLADLRSRIGKRMMLCAIWARHWVFRHYLWIAVALLVLCFGLVLRLQLRSFEQWSPILGVPFAFVFVMQKQKAQELELFRNLFSTFNARYDNMNEQLNSISRRPSVEELKDHEITTLFNYFNLCGEEYLYYSQGYIYPEVWKAWHNGMMIFRENPRIQKLWDEELKTDSYYGLTFPPQREQARQAHVGHTIRLAA